ncbi:transposable element Tcb1 transposase [Trichonephila clavipes]|nr:transposable element Tcb1 transposase [Trichonephila clavipes]
MCSDVFRLLKDLVPFAKVGPTCEPFKYIVMQTLSSTRTNVSGLEFSELDYASNKNQSSRTKPLLYRDLIEARNKILDIFKKIGNHVGRNETTVMRICDRWMQKGMKERRGRSHPPQCTTSRQDRQIVRMAVTDLSVTSRTLAHHIESVTHYSESARTIRRRLQQSGLSARRPLLGLPLTQNHRRLRYQWCDERRMWVAEWNEVVFTDKSRICLQHHDGRIRVWGGIGYLSRTPLVRIAGTLNSQRYISEVLEPVVLPYLQVTAIFQQDNARPHVARIVQRFFVNLQIELLPWLARSLDLSPIENMWSMVTQRLT